LRKDDVEAAVLKVIAQHSGKGPEYAAAFVAEMRRQKWYLRDVY
jgi:sulfite reductase (NADPH) flavoprotein alpha-component